MVQVVGGNTTRSTAVALPMGIVERRTDLVVRLGETRWLIVKRAQGSRLADRAAICLAIVLEAAAWAMEGEELAEAIAVEELAEAIEEEGSAEVQQAVETVVHLGVDPEGSTDQAHAPTAAGAVTAALGSVYASQFPTGDSFPRSASSSALHRWPARPCLPNAAVPPGLFHARCNCYCPGPR